MPKPGFNPNNEDHLQSLYRSDEWSYKQLEGFRKHNVRCQRQLAGQFYGEQNDGVKVPVNMLELAYTIYLRHLSGGTPRLHSWSRYRDFRAYALDFELAMNDLLLEIQFVRTMRAVVGNALLSMAPVKIGVEAGENIEHYSERKFVDAIGLDNWTHDMTADCWGNVQYMGNEYTMVEEIAKETKAFDRRQSSKLEASDDSQINETGDEKSHAVSTMSSLQTEGKIHKVVRLKDYWLPKERLFVTIDANRILRKPLRVIEWERGQGDPFEILSYLELQGNTVPLPPSALWMDLHRLANNIFIKLENQARNARWINTFTGADAEKDAERLDKTNDGGWAHLNNPQGINSTKTTGIDPQALAFLIQVKDLFAYFGGNLDALGGLGPQSPTLGQDQLLLSGASQRLAEMQDRTHEFMGRVIRTLAYYEHTGDGERMLKKKVKGTDIELDVQWNNARRKQMGPLSKYQIEIQPYSFAGTSPGMKLQGLMNILQNVIIPLLPMWQAKGYDLDPRQLVETFARLGNLPELEALITEGAIPIEQTEGENSSPKKSATSKRTYERVNRSQATRQTRDGALMQSLLGKGIQNSEAGKMTGALG